MFEWLSKLLARFRGDGESDADESDADEEQSPSFRELLSEHGGDYIAALHAKSMEAGLDEEGQIVRITDAMLRGDFDDEEFLLLARLPRLRGCGSGASPDRSGAGGPGTHAAAYRIDARGPWMSPSV